MKLALSSAAAPDASLAELASSARRRGMRALELVQGDGHGMLPPIARRALEEAVLGLRQRDVTVSALRCTDLGSALYCVDAARAFAAHVLVPGVDAAAFPLRLAALQESGIEPVLTFEQPDHLIEAAESLRGERVAFAWDVRPGACNLADAAHAVLAAVGGRLRHVRLHGGGPEAIAQEGLGVGTLMSRLALSGYPGTVALAPTDARSRVVWNAWLGRRGGWGCGSKVGAGASLPLATLGAQ